MKDRLRQLLKYIGSHGAGAGIAAVTMAIAFAVVKGAAGQEIGFDPGGIDISVASGISGIPDKKGYDLSGQGENSQEINHDSGSHQEGEENQDKPEDETRKEETEEDDQVLDDTGRIQNRDSSQVILPEGITDDLDPSETMAAMVKPDSREDENGPGQEGGNRQSSFRKDKSRYDDDDDDDDNSGSYRPSGGGNSSEGGSSSGENGGNQGGGENGKPSQGDENKPETPGGEGQPGEEKPGEVRPDPPVPGPETPPEEKVSVVIGGEKMEFDSEDDALAWIADKNGTNDEGKYFEGFVKDENGNYVPSYTDKDNFGGNDDTMWDYTGDSGVFVVPNGTRALELAMIANNEKIKTIVIPMSVTSVINGEGNSFPALEKFVVSKDNPYFVSEEGVLYRRIENGGTLLHRMPAAKTEIRQWPSDLRVIGENAFSYSVLDTAELPDTVTTLENMAFNDSFVGNIVLPESVKSIGSFAFGFHAPPEGQEASFHRITVKAWIPPQITASAFYYMDHNLEKKTGDPVTEIMVPDSEEDKIYETYLEVWGAALDKRYGGGTALRILKTENGAQTRYEFYEKDGKSGYKKTGQELPPVLSDSLGRYRTDEDGRLILIQCTSTASVVDLSSSEIVSIEEGAFDGCQFMTAVRLPETLETMAEDVFAHNTDLKVIIACGLTPPAEKTGASESCALFVRPEALDSYEAAWGGQMRKILGTSQSYTVTSSGLVFDRNSTRLLDIPADMAGLTIPGYVTAIYDRAAAGNPVLSRITVPPKVTEVGEGAFADCTGLTGVSWATAGAVPDSCFEGCVKLKTFGASGQGHNLTSIGNRAFYGCRELQTVLYYSYTENSTAYYYYYFLEYIGEKAFYGCGSMTYAYLHGSVTHVGAGAFGDSGLTQVFWYTKTAVPDGCFEYCQDLSSLAFGDGGLMTAAVGDRSFYGCAGLKTLLLPSMLESVGEAAFDGRDGSPLTLTFAAEIPPVWAGPESTDALIVYVPDSEDSGDRIYLDYADTWAHWLGQEAGRILKTKDNAQDRVFPGSATLNDAVRRKTEREVPGLTRPSGTWPKEAETGGNIPEEAQPGTATPGDGARTQEKREIQAGRSRTERKRENTEI